MERTAGLEEASEIFGNRLIGPAEIRKYSAQLGIQEPYQVPNIPYSVSALESRSKDYLLLLGTSHMTSGVPLCLLELRKQFGVNPERSEPCFYNQDWYMNETFMSQPLTSGWYMVRRSVFESSRAQSPELEESNYNLPSAILCAYAFFINYYCTGEYLWEHDFVWCTDRDHNGDRIYVGKYHDITGINKNGFSIHRHLALRKWYGFIDSL